MKIGSLEKGKMAELAVFGELLKRGVIPYVPLVDIKGIDAIIRKDDGRLLEIQVKSTFSKGMQGSFNVDDLVTKPNFFIIGVIGEGDMPEKYEYWVFPSEVFHKNAQQISPPDKGYTTYRLDLWYGKRKEGAYLKDTLRKFCNNWDPLVE